MNLARRCAFSAWARSAFQRALKAAASGPVAIDGLGRGAGLGASCLTMAEPDCVWLGVEARDCSNWDFTEGAASSLTEVGLIDFAALVVRAA